MVLFSVFGAELVSPFGFTLGIVLLGLYCACGGLVCYGFAVLRCFLCFVLVTLFGSPDLLNLRGLVWYFTLLRGFAVIADFGISV